ncbi:MAG: hypothetical protein M1818_000677 [Claussenomyces sp. TS43310]|nr:MAG: hypothetical protein M1818_000677 [Claussenomyces sp. TS43310]
MKSDIVESPDPKELNPMQEKIVGLASKTLELPPSCIEFSPRYRDFFVIGTYNLQKESADDRSREEEEKEKPKKSQSRDGSLLLFKIKDDNLELAFMLPHHAAILDLHFRGNDGVSRELFVVANSTGEISLYELDMATTPSIKWLKDFGLFATTTLILSCAWHPTFSNVLGVTLSTGSATLLKFNEDLTEVEVIKKDLNLHSNGFMNLECWTLAFSPAKHDALVPKDLTQSLYTGGDDSKLRCTTFLDAGMSGLPFQKLAAVAPGGSRGMTGHGAGVTAILPLPLGLPASEGILITGSYDDHVRIYATFDHRTTSTDTSPKVLSELNVGGGVWRLKFMEPSRIASQHISKEADCCKFKILASCMHAGVRILEVEGSILGEWTIRVLAQFVDHQSMNYASDVQPSLRKRIEEERVICVSTSFYDRLLSVWRFDDTKSK